MSVLRGKADIIAKGRDFSLGPDAELPPRRLMSAARSKPDLLGSARAIPVLTRGHASSRIVLPSGAYLVQLP